MRYAPVLVLSALIGAAASVYTSAAKADAYIGVPVPAVLTCVVPQPGYYGPLPFCPPGYFYHRRWVNGPGYYHYRPAYYGYRRGWDHGHAGYGHGHGGRAHRR